MNAYLINPTTQEIVQISIEGGLSQIAELLGAKSIDFDEIDDNGDRLYFDEDCFIKAKPGDARFKVDNLAPVSGCGIICGSTPANLALRDAQTEKNQLVSRTQFL